MKKRVFILSLLLTGAIVAFHTACEKDPVEACEQDLFCDGTMEVTACCTDGTDCYYTYNGQEYPDTEQGLADLVEALDCGTTKSISIDGENDSMFVILQSLLEKARELSNRQ